MVVISMYLMKLIVMNVLVCVSSVVSGVLCYYNVLIMLMFVVVVMSLLVNDVSYVVVVMFV